jgi:glycosyltransferase involved in cell wall biosynthesis
MESSLVDFHGLPLVEDKPVISLVMPAYNEEDVIEEVVRKVDSVMAKIGLTYELIIVDDGSVDNTRRKLATFVNMNSYNHVKVIGYDKNVGKGYAVKTGFVHAEGEIVIFMDSDAEIDPKQLVRYIKALKNADIVVASKWHPQSKVDIPLIRRILSRGFNLLVKLLVGLKLNDTQTGLKAIRKSVFVNVFPKLNVKRYAFDVELLTLADLLGLKIVELPVNIRLCSRFSLKEVWRMFLDLLGITYRLRVNQWYQRTLAERDNLNNS